MDSKLDFTNYHPISIQYHKNIGEIKMHFFNFSMKTYPLQLGLRQNYSTFHALFSLTEDIR